MKLNFKKFFCFSIACAMIVSCFNMFGHAKIETSADFEKNAQQVVDEIILGWNLGNSLDSYTGTAIKNSGLSSETSWGNPATTQEIIDMVKDTGINAIRVPVTWYNHMDADTYEIDEAWLNRVKDVVNYVLEDGMYCILNVHHDTGENGWLRASRNNFEQNAEMFTAIWEQVSEEFADYNDKLLFEGFNEILNDSNEWVNPDTEALEVVNELNQIFVDTVRNSGGNNDKRNLIVNTYCAGGNSAVTRGFILPDDSIPDRLIVEAHVYQPFYFTSEFYPDVTTWSQKDVNAYIDNLYETFVKQDIPVIIGEFGCVEKNNADQRLSWTQYYVQHCIEYGIKCFWWDNGSQYKLFNRRTLNITEPELLNAMLAAANGEEYIANMQGDVNNDGVVDVKDVKYLQDYLHQRVTSISINADMNQDNMINIYDLCLLKNLLLAQKNLCANENNWNSWTDTAEHAESEFFYINKGVSMLVTSGGNYEWNAQCYYENITLEQETTYQISFDYVSDSEQSTSFHIMQGHDEYLPYFSDSLKWTTEIQHYEETFTYISATDKNCRIGFNLGGVGVDVPFEIKITNLKLVRIN
ncbi:MAG: cellulase family glycosylhydrolase [Ruminococcus sp.]|nr:cellulase family glycosylhydrolase [Ruminococcus sp.]